MLDEVVVLSNLGKTAVGDEEDTQVQDEPADISQQDRLDDLLVCFDIATKLHACIDRFV